MENNIKKGDNMLELCILNLTFLSGFQYQFDGNSNLVYTIIRKRQVFHALANLPSDCNTIAKSLSKRQRRPVPASTSNENVSETAMEGSHPAQPAEPGTLKASLLETPGESLFVRDLALKFKCSFLDCLQYITYVKLYIFNFHIL